MTKRQIKKLVRIILSAVATAILLLLPLDGVLKFLLFLAVYLLIGYDILFDAVWGLLRGQLLDENFLMAIATVGAFTLAIITKSGDYLEAIAVMLLFQLGELFESVAIGKSRKSIASLMDIRPDYANIEVEGKLERVDPYEIEIGSEIVVLIGEKIPIDGVILSGSSSVNASALTGESMPKDVAVGDSVLSGCINLSGVLKIKTVKRFEESTASKILDLVENASSKKSKSESFISKFARVYTPAVCIFALLLAVLPPLFNILVLNAPANWLNWLYQALTCLVISCPCALVISIPLSFFAGIGGASANGILIKGSNYLETLSNTEYVVFDKTGTLTKGSFEVAKINANGLASETLLEYAALAESASSHPISKSLISHYGKEIERSRVSDICEKSGLGVIAVVDGKKVAVGNEKLMAEVGVKATKPLETGTVVNVAIDGVYCGNIVISDVLKDTSKKAVSNLSSIGIKTAMLTGDADSVAQSVAQKLGITRVYSELLPHEKVERVEEILSDAKKKQKVVFVGDGINDAPVLARADIGIAMGGVGSDSAIEASDVVIMDDNPEKIVKAVKIARKCLKIVKQNTVFSITVKLFCLALGAVGLANMWLAIFADVGVMVLAVLNAIRALYVKNI